MATRSSMRFALGLIVLALAVFASESGEDFAAPQRRRAAHTSADPCASNFAKKCDDGFDVELPAIFGTAATDVPAPNGITFTPSGTVSETSTTASLKVQRWKCVCSTCNMRRRTDAKCQSKCTRGDSKDVVKYYEFKAAHCDKKLTAAKQKATVDKLDAIFKGHGLERLGDLTQKIIMASSPAPSPPRANCMTDLKACAKFQSFTANEGCTFASVTQLSALIASGPDGYKDTEDYVRKLAPNYGLSSDCIKVLDPRYNYSPLTSTTLPDGRTGRQLLVMGVPPDDLGMRWYGANPKDGMNVAYPTIQLQGFRKPGTSKKKNCDTYMLQNAANGNVNFIGTYRGRAALQVSLCKGGVVRGASNMIPYTPPVSIQKRTCGGTMTNPKLDAIFRQALAYARFQLARLWQNVETRGFDKPTSNHVCSKSSHWDGMACMNWMLLQQSANTMGQCYLVDVKSVDYLPGFGAKDEGQYIWGPFNQLKFFNDGYSAGGLPLFRVGWHSKPGRSALSTPTAQCSDGKKHAGKCTIKVCHRKLVFFLRRYLKVILKWKYLGKTITKSVKADKISDKWVEINWDGTNMKLSTTKPNVHGSANRKWQMGDECVYTKWKPKKDAA